MTNEETELVCNRPKQARQVVGRQKIGQKYDRSRNAGKARERDSVPRGKLVVACCREKTCWAQG